MTADRAGLRLRLFAIVVAATLLPAAPVAIALLLQVRDALYARKVADAREGLARAVAAASSCRDAACVAAIGSVSGAGVRPGACEPRTRRSGNLLLLCEPWPPGGSFESRVDLGPVREEIAALDRRVLALLTVFASAIVVLGAWLLDRGVVRRLARVDEALEKVGAEHDSELLPEGGDAVGRVGAAVNRLAQRLRDERQRIRAQIGQLEQANREIRAARAEVARGEQLAGIGRLAAGVAHEVGNPVSAVIAYAALLREGLAAGKDVSEYADRIEREAGRVDRILRDLLDLTRPRQMELASVELEVTLAAARLAVPGVAVEAVRLPRVKAEEHYLSQIFVNLLSNAARAGATTVQVSTRDPEPGFTELDLEDDGRGIPPEALPRLFEPFFTTSAPGQGTGLGLALCHAMMERFGGSIAAKNRAHGTGAVFTLRFKRA